MRTLWIGLSVSLLAACATERTRLGEVRLRPASDPTATPAVFSVQDGRILNPDVDIVAVDRCLRGTVSLSFLQVCEEPAAAEGTRHFTGTGGDFVVALQDGGKALRMDGYLRLASHLLPMHQTVAMGSGAAWDELRRQPGLLAIAAAAAAVGKQVVLE